MTRGEELCERFAREHPVRATHKRFAQANDAGEWGVIKMRLPKSPSRDAINTTVEAKPKPPRPGDPRVGGDSVNY
jgi:hypothetical protein